MKEKVLNINIPQDSAASCLRNIKTDSGSDYLFNSLSNRFKSNSLFPLGPNNKSVLQQSAALSFKYRRLFCHKNLKLHVTV